ncbi:4'-phosphopantetheinyl transferase [Streptomyces sp. NPDC020965]|uniref:4'-phosphopantetheinyl transferase n=1 Tax=Streptomyces sp. NPDC020965 TaxID=3365105 RepID=UPI003793BA1F
MLRRILPPGVVVHEMFDDPDGIELHPGEAELIAHAVDARRREFTTVRHCARAALRELGQPPIPVLPDAHGAPRWPASVVGSLTHCAGYRAAALARAGDILMIGIDAEPHGPLPAGVADSIALPGELARLAAARRARPGLHTDRLLFSAKEAVYKSWYTYGGQRLEFEDADITFAYEDGAAGRAIGTFTARLRAPRPVRPDRTPYDTLRGRWLIQDGLLVTAIAVVPPAGGRHSGPVGIPLGGSRP